MSLLLLTRFLIGLLNLVEKENVYAKQVKIQFKLISAKCYPTFGI